MHALELKEECLLRNIGKKINGTKVQCLWFDRKFKKPDRIQYLGKKCCILQSTIRNLDFTVAEDRKYLDWNILIFDL